MSKSEISESNTLLRKWGRIYLEVVIFSVPLIVWMLTGVFVNMILLVVVNSIWAIVLICVGLKFWSVINQQDREWNRP